ncbi:MAG: 30S ribosomal protein S6 [Chloroflexi bacterium]|nr:30S ribosomal protein S6 [Chloroflexota bacterium]
MSHYELIYVLQPDLDEVALAAQNERIQQVITANGGRVASSELMGRRTLAYPIKRRKEGYYMLVKATFTPAVIKELERSLRISEDVLRYMMVRLDDAEGDDAMPETISADELAGEAEPETTDDTTEADE